MYNKRAQRVAQLLRNELSALTVQGLRDPRVGLVTVTEVKLTDDLRSARVFVSVLGDAEARKASLAGLTAASGYLRHEITHRLQLRFAPTLTFYYDDTLVRAQRLDALLGASARGEDAPAQVELAENMPAAETGREQRTLAGTAAPTPITPPKKRRPKKDRRRVSAASKPRGNKQRRGR